MYVNERRSQHPPSLVLLLDSEQHGLKGILRMAWREAIRANLALQWPLCIVEYLHRDLNPAWTPST